MHNMVKCRMKRGVTGFLPPPGGAQAAHTVMSCKIQRVVHVHRGTLNTPSHQISQRKIGKEVFSFSEIMSVFGFTFTLNFFRFLSHDVSLQCRGLKIPEILSSAACLCHTSHQSPEIVSTARWEAGNRKCPALACSDRPQI